MTANQLKNKIANAFSSVLNISKSNASKLLPSKLTSGKAYEAHVLSLVCENLKYEEGCKLALKGGSNLVLKTSYGPINRSYPWIEVSRQGKIVGEIFTDVEFLTLSYYHQSHQSPKPGNFHELDILLVKEGITDRPQHSDILLGVECKNTGYTKSLLKEILGIRREMSFLVESNNTAFKTWPRAFVPANPSSCLLVYSTSSRVTQYSDPGNTFGIDFIHYEM